MRNSLPLCFAAVAALAAGASADLRDANLQLTLHGALVRAPDDRRDLVLELQVADGAIVPGFVRGRGLTQGRHVGTVTSAAFRDGALNVEVALTVKPDLWLGGGTATYSIQAKLADDGKTLAGDYTGLFTPVEGTAPPAPPRKPRQPVEPPAPLPPEVQKLLERMQGPGKPPEPAPPADTHADPGSAKPPVQVRGDVAGTVLDLWPLKVAGHVPVRPGEHPRLIFRPADLPALRKKAETPEGMAVMERFWKVIDYSAHDGSHKFDSWPGVGYGFAYQMTGDKKYADKARDLIDAKFFKRHPIGGQDIHHAPQLQGLALTFDLCYDAWDGDFRQRCIDEIWQRTLECATGTAGGNRMGGLNLAYWSNHNGIRAAGAGLGALAVWNEKTSDGTLLDQQALAVADEAAYDARGWVRDGCGGGAWFMEGLFYKGMTLVRGLAHFLHAYPTATGTRILAPGFGDHLIAGHFIEADPGNVAVGLSPTGVLAGSSGIDSDSWGELIWTSGLAFVPNDMMPALKYLHTRAVGLQGDRTFGLDRACYAPYLLVNYPSAVTERHPGLSLRWMSPDPVNGHWVFRPAWKDGRDILMTWNMLTHVRSSCHYERVGPALHWRLVGFGEKWLDGRFQPVVKGKENVLAHDPVGARLLDSHIADRTAVVTFDMTPAYMPLLDRKRGDNTSWDVLAKKAGALRAVGVPDGVGMRADMGISGRRHVAVDASGDSGAPLLVAVLDEILFRDALDAQPAPAGFHWRLPLAAKDVTADGNTFALTRGNAVLSGVVLGGGPVQKDGTVDVAQGKVLAVFLLHEAPAPKVNVTGTGADAAVSVGKRTVRFDGNRLVLE